MIQRGQVDAMLAGGACSVVSPVGILAFSVLGALSPNPDPDQASRPFDRRRDGFVMGEGAGVVVLESLDHARARGARIYGEVAGYGTTLNASNLTDPSPDGASEERAMRLALGEAALAPEQIDYVAAHGTSTPKNDAVETAALKRVFGAHARRLMVSSNKGQIGHTISAAGVCNLVCALKSIVEGWVPPTAHYRDADPQCDLDYVPNVGRRAAVRAALVNAFAFGGQNAVLAVKAA
jgi:3-oxoacyl-[acyl-carrier-protein] synthase II